jgi:nicotinamidase-related amidase
MKRALIVIDVQNEYFSGVLPITHPQGHLANIRRVMDTANAKEVPVVVVQHTVPDPKAGFFQRGTASGTYIPRSKSVLAACGSKRICPGVSLGPS